MYPCSTVVQGIFKVLFQETGHFCDLLFDKLEVWFCCSHHFVICAILS